MTIRYFTTENRCAVRKARSPPPNRIHQKNADDFANLSVIVELSSPGG